MKTQTEIEFIASGVVAKRHKIGSSELEDKTLSMQLLPRIESYMHPDGSFFADPFSTKFESVSGILYKSDKGLEVIVPYSQYLEWNRPEKIKATVESTYGPI